MTEEARVKLVFETISKVAGFKIEIETKFCITIEGEKNVYLIDRSLNLFYRKPNGCFGRSDYNILPILQDEYELEEYKEPSLAGKEKEFLRHFKFDALVISTLLYMYIYDKSRVLDTINLNNTNLSFDGLEKGRTYSRPDLGL